MAPQTARKRKSDELDEGPSTPTQTPKPKRMKITQMQKQALLDNLQLEITERARQLRAHYALQCQDLKARIERRINRVPVGMRKMKMVELVVQYAKASKDQATASTSSEITKTFKLTLNSSIEPAEWPLPSIPEQQHEQQQQKLPSPVRKPVPQLNHPPKSRKRKSSAIHISSDKENTSQVDTDLETSNTPIETESLPVQKNAKRAKTTTTAAAPKRTASKGQNKPATRSKDTDKHTGILSPRSHNSRTLPRSPIKDTQLPPSPTKPTHFAPTSPPKQPQSPQRPASPLKSAATAATSALSAFAKRGAAAATAAANLRPSSRNKTTVAAIAVAAGALASPTGKMLPPARPALATVTSSSAHATSTFGLSTSKSPQRSVSQASARSSASEQSTTSTNGTVVMKPTKSTTGKQDTRGRAAAAKKTTAAKTQAVIGESTVAPLSPKTGNTRGGVKRAATTAAARATAAVKRAGTLKKAASNATEPSAATETGTTGRVLRKRY